MTLQETAKYIFNYLIKNGVTKAGACAIIGNLQAESGLVSNNLENNYNISFGMSDEQYTNAVNNNTYSNFVHDHAGYGLAQWTYYTRKQKLLTFARGQGKSIDNLDMQLDFLKKEFQEDFPSLWNQLKSSNNLYDLTWLLLDKWENPAVKNISTRYQFAQNWFNTLTSTQNNNLTIAEAKNKVLAVAVSNLGYHEVGNNGIKFAEGDWDNKFYGWELNGQPWCDVYADYCYCEPFGIEKGKQLTYQTSGGSALCRTSAQYYKNNNAWFNYPEVADQIFFYYGGDINHTGIVETINGEGANWTSITTIEGNSADMVARRTYRRGDSTIAGFGRPNWKVVATESSTPTSSTPTTDNLHFGMQKSEEVKKLQQNLIKLGYNLGKWGADGDFGPDTLAAVKQFQRDKGLQVTGMVNNQMQEVIKKALETPSSSITTFAKGDKVKIKVGSTYYNSPVKVPQFVLDDTWIILSVSGDRAVINKNISGSRSIMSPVNTNNLIKV